MLSSAGRAWPQDLPLEKRVLQLDTGLPVRLCLCIYLPPVCLEWGWWGPSTVAVQHPQPFALHLNHQEPLP